MFVLAAKREGHATSGRGCEFNLDLRGSAGTQMQDEEFKSLLTHAENDWLDWKRDFPPGLLEGSKAPGWAEGKAELLKDIASLANGFEAQTCYLIMGVKDRGATREILGITKSWDDANFQTWANNALDPPTRFTYHEIQYGGKITIGIFSIERVPEFPHVFKASIGGRVYEGQVWFRKGTQNSVALRDELVRMAKGDEPFCISSAGDEVCKNLIKEFQSQGTKIAICNRSNRDSYLARDYRLVYYPGTRREIWVGYYQGEFESILLCQPEDKDRG